MASVKKTILLNGFGQISNRAVRALEQLVMVPIFLSMWGSDYYGEWLTISIIPSILAFSDLGFGTAVSNSFALAYSNDEKQKAGNVYVTGLIVISFTVLLGIFLSFLIVFFSWKTGLLEKAVIPIRDIIVSLVFLMGGRLIAFYSQLFEGFFRVKHKAYLDYYLHTLESFLRVGVGIVTILLGYNIIGYSIGQFIIVAVFIVLFAIIARGQVKDLPRGMFKKDIFKDSLVTGFGFMLTPVWQGILYQGSTFVVRIVLGPVAVAAFNTVRTVCQSISSLFSIVYGAVFPEMQIAYGKKDMTLLKRIYVYSMQVVFVLSIVGLVFLLIWGQAAYSWWTHNSFEVSNFVWWAFMIGIPFNALWNTSSTIFRAVNKPHQFSMYGLITATISTVLSFILAHIVGLPGAAMGFISMDIIMFFLLVPLANKLIEVQFTDLFNIKDVVEMTKGFIKRKTIE